MNAELDRVFGGEDGESPIRFQHDADQVIGRIRKDGGWDRRYRIRYEERPIYLPELNLWSRLLEIAALTLYVLILFGSIIFLAAYFAFWMPVEVMAPR